MRRFSAMSSIEGQAFTHGAHSQRTERHAWLAKWHHSAPRRRSQYVFTCSPSLPVVWSTYLRLTSSASSGAAVALQVNACLVLTPFCAPNRYLAMNHTHHELLSASYCAANGSVEGIPLHVPSELQASVAKSVVDVSASRGVFRFNVLFAVDRTGQNRKPPYFEAGSVEFRAVIYDAHSVSAPVGSHPPSHPLGYRSHVFFDEDEARAYEEISKASPPALFSPPHTSASPPKVGHEGRGAELILEHSQYHRWRIAMSDCVSEIVSCAHHALRSVAPFMVPIGTGMEVNDAGGMAILDGGTAKNILADTVRISCGSLQLLSAASACCASIADSIGQASQHDLRLAYQHADRTMNLVRDLKLLLKKMRTSDTASAFLDPDKLLLELDLVDWSDDMQGLLEVAMSAIPRIKGVVDFARLEFAELTLLYACPNLLKYFNACKNEYDQPAVFSTVDKLNEREKRFPLEHVPTGTLEDSAGRKPRRKLKAQELAQRSMIPMNTLNHGREKELELTLHQGLSFDLRLCPQYDAFFSRAQEQAAKIQYAVDTNIDKVFADWVTEIVSRRPLSLTPSGVACRLLSTAMWNIDRAVCEQSVYKISQQCLVLSDLERDIYCAAPTTAKGVLFYGSRTALVGVSITTFSDIFTMLKWALTEDVKESEASSLQIVTGCYGPVTKYGGLLSHLHSAQFMEVHRYGDFVRKSNSEAKSSVLRDFALTAGIPQFAHRIIMDVSRQIRESSVPKNFVSHMTIGGTRFDPPRILSDATSMVETVVLAVETGAEVSVTSFVKVDEWRLLSVTKHIQYLEAGNFAQMRPIYLREQNVPLNS
mmetsp:Transcript_8464/g.25247  ORF Transcript_8464/g.25247 Transcript_8464/m.25247 type:complete len:821 (-) Transcript_8464:762-3224(-)